MWAKYRAAVLCLLITAAYFVFVNGLYGVYDDTRDIAYRTCLLRGDFTGVTIGNLFIYFIGTAKILSLLLNKFPEVPWVALQLLWLHLFSVAVVSYLLLTHLFKRGVSLIMAAIVSTALVFLLFSESLFYLSIACASMTGAVSAVLLWLYVIPNQQNAVTRWCLRLVGTLSFAVAVLTQNEVVMIGLSAAFLFLILCFENKIAVLRPAVLVLVLYIAVYASMHLSNNFYLRNFLKNEAYLFTYYDTYFSKSTTPSNTADAVKIDCMKQWFVWDQHEFNASFFEKYTTANYRFTLNRNSFQEKSFAYLRGLSVGLFHRLLPLLALNILVTAWALFVFRNRKNLFLFFFFYKVLLLLFFSSVSVVLKFEFRLLNAVFLFDTFLSMMFLLKNQLPKDKYSTWLKSMLYLFTTCFLIWGCWWKHNYFLQCRDEQIAAINESNRLRKQIDTKFQNQILVPDLAFLLYWQNNSPLHTAPITKTNTVMGYDAGYTTYYAEFNNLLKDKCGNDDFQSFMAYTWQQKEKVVFIASADKIDLWKRYLAAVYHIKSGFVKIEDPLLSHSNNIDGGKTFAYYRINAFEQMH